MKVIGKWGGLIFLGCLALSSFVHARDVDPVRAAERARFPLPLRWINVRAAPVWVAGVPPRRCGLRGLFSLSLRPGEETVIHCPAGSYLRLVPQKNKRDLREITSWSSDGTGLFAEVPLVPTESGGGLLLPPAASPRIIRLVQASPASSRFYLFYSWQNAQGRGDAYTAPIRLPGQAGSLETSVTSAHLPHWRVSPFQPTSLTLTRGGWYRLETRYIYGLNEARPWQQYQATLKIGGKKPRTIYFASRFDTSFLFRLENQVILLGTRDDAYFYVPAEGAKVSFVANVALLTRLVYAPKSVKIPDCPDLRKKIANAARLAQTNRQQNTGLQAAAALTALTQTDPTSFELRRLAKNFWFVATFSRRLMPTHKTHPAQFQTRSFLPLTLLDPAEKISARVSSEAQSAWWLGRIPKAQFSPVASGAPLVYQLRPDSVPGRLQLLVDRAGLNSRVRFSVQFDSAVPRSFEVCPQRFVAGDKFSPSPPLVSLNLWQQSLRDELGNQPPPPLPAPLTEVARTQIVLPPGTKSIKIKCAAAYANPLMFSVLSRQGRPFSLSDSQVRAGLQFNSAKKKIRTKNKTRLKTLLHTPQPTSPLEETYTALRRLLNSQAAAFRYGIPATSFLRGQVEKNLKPSPSSPPAPALVSPIAAPSRPREEYNQLMKLLRSPAAKPQAAVYHRLCRVLDILGESYLANRLRRGLVIYHPEATVRQVLLRDLRQQATSQKNERALARITSFALLRQVAADTIQQRLRLLIAEGSDQLALLLAQAAQPFLRREDITAAIFAACRKDSWSFALRLNQRLSRPEQPRLYALQALRDGRLENFSCYLEQTDVRQKSLRKKLQTFTEILTCLSSNDSARRYQGLRVWEDLRRENLAKEAWVPAPDLVANAAGSAQVYSIERDLYAMYFSASLEQPLKIVVQGPTEIRLQARLLHDTKNPQARDDWLIITTAGRQHVVPINRSVPASGVRLVTESERLPGTVTQTNIFVPAGRYTFFVRPQKNPAVVQVLERRSSLWESRFPRWQPALLAQLLAHPLLSPLPRESESDADADANEARVLEPITAALKNQTIRPFYSVTLVAANPSDEIRKYPVFPLAPFKTEGGGGVTQLSGQEKFTPNVADNWLHDEALSPELRIMKLQKSGRLKQALPALLETRQLPARLKIELALAAKKWDWLLTSDLQENANEQVAALMYLAEYSSSESLRQQAGQAALALFVKYAATGKMENLRLRLLRNSAWEPVDTVLQSAGIRQVKVSASESASPIRGIRTALLNLNANQPGEYLLRGDQQLTARFHNPRPSHLKIRLTSVVVPGILLQALRVFWRLDQEAPQSILLLANQSAPSINLTIPAGSHQVRLSLKTPPRNHFLRVSLAENGKPLQVERTRTYRIATPQTPLVLCLRGPTWLRIDTLQKGGLPEVENRPVQAGLQNITIVPDANSKERLVRLFVRTYQTAPPGGESLLVTPLSPARVPVRVPDASLRLGLPRAPSSFRVTDLLSLAAQNRGDWSLGTLWQQRRQFDEGGSQNLEKFFENKITYRGYSPRWQSYFVSSILGRVRNDSGSTIGLEQSIFFRPQNHPLAYNLQLRGYVQTPGGDKFSSSGTSESSLSATFSILQPRGLTAHLSHLPRLDLFQRWLSVTDGQQALATGIDQDIYSRYKADHRYGLRLSDTFIWKPTEDTEWRGRLGTALNENGSFEQLNFDIEGRHWFGAWHGSVGYRGISFLADSDRRATLWRDALLLRAGWESRRSAKGQLEFGLQLRHDLEPSINSALFSLTWHFSQAQGYEARPPGSPRFRRQRARRFFLFPTSKVTSTDAP